MQFVFNNTEKKASSFGKKIIDVFLILAVYLLKNALC